MNIQNNRIDTEWVDKKLNKLRVILIFFLYAFMGYILFFSSYKPELLLKPYYALCGYALLSMFINTMFLFFLRKSPQITEKGVKLDPYSRPLQNLFRQFTLYYFLYGLFSHYKKVLLFLPWSQIEQISVAPEYAPHLYVFNLSYRIIIQTLDKKVYSQYVNDKRGFIKAVDQLRVKELKSVQLRGGVRWSR